MIYTGVPPAGSASPPPTLAKGVVVVPEPLTNEIITQTVLRIQDGAVPILNHQDAWGVTPEVILAMERLMAIVDWVRSPAGGWPSDRVVEAKSLLPYVADEAMEVLDSLEKSWMYPGLPGTHPFAPLQKLLGDRLMLSDAIAQFLWGVARSSVETMQLLGGIPVEVFQAGQDWTPGILRLMTVLMVQTNSLHWTFDLVTAEAPLPELHYDALIRWPESGEVFWAEGLLQSLHRNVMESTLPLHNLLEQAVPGEIIAPSQSWQNGSLRLHLGFTFAPHAKKPALNIMPSSLPVPELPQPQQWEEYHFTLTPQAPDRTPEPIAEVPSPAILSPTVSSPKASSPSPRAVEGEPADGEPEEALFEDSWFLGGPVFTEGEEIIFGAEADPPSGADAIPQMENGRPSEDLFSDWTEDDLEDSSIADFEIALDSVLNAPVSQPTPIAPTSPTIPSFADLENLAPKTPPDQPAPTNSKVAVVMEPQESWDLEQWRVHWNTDNHPLGSDWLQLPRSYHVKTLLTNFGTRGPVSHPVLHRETRLLELINLACQALKLPDPPPTILSTGFVMPESSLAALVHRLAWNLIRHSYSLTCLLSGVPAEILQPEWGWESGILRLLPILQVKGEGDLDLQIDLGTGAAAPLETVLVLPDILVNIDGPDWQKTREPALQFRAHVVEQVYSLLPELEVLGCAVPVELTPVQGIPQSGTLKLHFELGFQGS